MSRFYIDDEYIAACREVDAMLPETPAIAPHAEAVMRRGLEVVAREESVAAKRKAFCDRHGILRVSELRDEYVWDGAIVTGEKLRKMGAW